MATALEGVARGSGALAGHDFCLRGRGMASAGDTRAGHIDPTVEATSAEGWRRWASELGHYDKDRLAGFGGIIVAGAVLGILLLYVFVRVADEVLGHETAALDSAAVGIVRRSPSPSLDALANGLSFMGSEAVLLFSLVLLGLFLWQRRWGAAGMLVLVSGGVQLLNDVLKSEFHRTRPEPVAGFIAAQQYSFPSGHAMVSSAFYFYLGYLCWRLVRGVWRGALIAGLLLLVILIGIARIYLQAHYFTDVIAGYLAGFVWADAVIIGSQLLVTRRLPRLHHHSAGPALTLDR